MGKTKDEILDAAFKAAKQYELKSGGCPQCTLAGIFDSLEIENDAVFKAATGLADGIGLTGNGHCGALSGGVLAISYFFGRFFNLLDPNDLQAALEAGMLERCSTLVGEVARMTTEIILEAQEEKELSGK